MRRELSSLLRELDVTAVPFTAEHHEAAWHAYEKYGRGRHKAGLNFGDCLSYAVAKLADDELLFVGDDFSRTDIAAARCPDGSEPAHRLVGSRRRTR